MAQDMTGQVVMITGASRGIGAETARVFAAAGARVVLLARSEDAISALAAEIGAQALALPCDVSDYAQMAAAVRATEDEFGPVTVLINNAGVIEPIAHLSDMDPAAWARTIEINLTGVFNGSGAASNPIEAWSHYCSSKAGAAMLTECAHKENHDKGLRIMGLSPGTVATQMQREIKASGINPVSQLDWEIHIPADWPARTLLWMCTPDADPWLGQEISLRDEAIRTKVGLS
jgi:NAD(P)-dependent dehydrogenase (short-subunit alcohol dehydrogenase family)